MNIVDDIKRAIKARKDDIKLIEADIKTLEKTLSVLGRQVILKRTEEPKPVIIKKKNKHHRRAPALSDERLRTALKTYFEQFPLETHHTVKEIHNFFKKQLGIFTGTWTLRERLVKMASKSTSNLKIARNSGKRSSIYFFITSKERPIDE